VLGVVRGGGGGGGGVCPLRGSESEWRVNGYFK